MDGKDILEMNKRVKPDDEGDVLLKNHARTFATAWVYVFLLLIILYNTFKGLDTYAPLAVSFAYTAIEALYRFPHSKNKLLLLGGIVCALFAIQCLVMYVLATW